MTVLLNQLSSQYISTYTRYKSIFSKICLLMQVGLFYEIQELESDLNTHSSVYIREIARLLKLEIAQKQPNSQLLVCGFPISASNEPIRVLLENGYAVVLMKQFNSQRTVTNVFRTVDDYY